MDVWVGGRGAAVAGAKPKNYNEEMEENGRKLTGFYSNKVGLLQFFSCHWVCTVLIDVFENETAFVDIS